MNRRKIPYPSIIPHIAEKINRETPEFAVKFSTSVTFPQTKLSIVPIKPNSTSIYFCKNYMSKHTPISPPTKILLKSLALEMRTGQKSELRKTYKMKMFRNVRRAQSCAF